MAMMMIRMHLGLLYKGAFFTRVHGEFVELQRVEGVAQMWFYEETGGHDDDDADADDDDDDDADGDGVDGDGVDGDGDDDDDDDDNDE
eukprot:10540979-Karenia_brevis.AAC.1